MSIISFITSLGLLIISFFKRNKNNKSFSPTILFFALWTMILFLSMLNLYNIYKPSNEAYLLIMLMLIFFFLGSITNLKKIKFFQKMNKSKIENENSANNGTNKNIVNIGKVGRIIFYVLSALLIIFYLIDCIVVIKGINDGVPLWKIRRWGMEPAGSVDNPLVARRTFIEDVFRSMILTPFSTLIPPIVAYMFFNSDSKKEKYKFLIISLIVLIISSVAGGGGRLGFIYYFGCFLLAFFILYKNKNISSENRKKYKKIIIVTFIIAFSLVAIYTMFRTEKGFIKEVYTYFALPPTLLSLWLPQIKNVEHTYGLLSFFGIHSYFFRILETIGLGTLVPEVYNNAYDHILNAEIFKNTGYGVGNAFVSPIYYFMIDGGYLFVCIASYFFGVIVSNLYNKFEENINIKTFVIYALIMYGVFLTFIRIQSSIPSYIISFLFIYLIFGNYTKLNQLIENKIMKKIKGDKNEKK